MERAFLKGSSASTCQLPDSTCGKSAVRHRAVRREVEEEPEGPTRRDRWHVLEGGPVGPCANPWRRQAGARNAGWMGVPLYQTYHGKIEQVSLPAAVGMTAPVVS